MLRSSYFLALLLLLSSCTKVGDFVSVELFADDEWHVVTVERIPFRLFSDGTIMFRVYDVEGKAWINTSFCYEPVTALGEDQYMTIDCFRPDLNQHVHLLRFKVRQEYPDTRPVRDEGISRAEDGSYWFHYKDNFYKLL